MCDRPFFFFNFELVSFIYIKEFVLICTVEDDNHFAESEDVTTEQKQRLLYTSERLNRSGIQLDNTYRITVETEEIGSQILTDLNRQRETMQSSFNRVGYF